MRSRQGDGRGVAAAALGAIVLVTVAWWMLALYPVGPGSPEWLLRTREVCFGTRASGLPNAGGWILLIGEPVGMVAVLTVIWGRALRADLVQLAGTRAGRGLLIGSAALVLGGGTAAVWRVRAATAPAAMDGAPTRGAGSPTATRFDVAAIPMVLTDQSGTTFDLRALRGSKVIVTFAFGHCETVCPTLVRDVLSIRRRARAEEIPLVVVTVDPWRDVPLRLRHLADAWGLGTADHVLSGSVADVLATLDDWGIGTSRDPRTGDVAHPAVVLVVNGEGRISARLDGNWGELSRVLSGG